MLIPPADPVSIVTTGISTTIRIFEITYQLKSVGPQTADVLKTIEHINKNIKEAQRLRREKADMLKPEEIEWMDGIIQDTLDARLAIARLIEPVRIDQQTKNSISLVHRALWVLRDKPDLVNKHMKLTEVHTSLNSVIACLYSRDAIVITPATNASVIDDLSPPPYDPQMTEFLDSRTSRRQRKGIWGLENGREERSHSSGSISSRGNDTYYATSQYPPPPPVYASSPAPVFSSPAPVFSSPAPVGEHLGIDGSDLRSSHPPLPPFYVSSSAPIFPSPTPISEHLGIDGPGVRMSQTQVASFGLGEAALWASNNPSPQIAPNPDRTSFEYLDESQAQHVLQYSNVTNAHPPTSTNPPRPPKIPLSSAVESQSNDIVERATAANPAKREELENNYKTIPYRNRGQSWLAYYAKRSDVGHRRPFP